MVPKGISLVPKVLALDSSRALMEWQWMHHQENIIVQVWGADRLFKHAFGSQGSGPGQFNQPSDGVVDAPSGNIIVADMENDQVRIEKIMLLIRVVPAEGEN